MMSESKFKVGDKVKIKYHDVESCTTSNSFYSFTVHDIEIEDDVIYYWLSNKRRYAEDELVKHVKNPMKHIKSLKLSF